MSMQGNVLVVDAWKYWAAFGSILLSIGLVTLSVATGEVSWDTPKEWDIDNV